MNTSLTLLHCIMGGLVISFLIVSLLLPFLPMSVCVCVCDGAKMRKQIKDGWWRMTRTSSTQKRNSSSAIQQLDPTLSRSIFDDGGRMEGWMKRKRKKEKRRRRRFFFSFAFLFYSFSFLFWFFILSLGPWTRDACTHTTCAPDISISRSASV